MDNKINQNITIKANPVKQYEDYLISDSAQVFSAKREIERKIDRYFLTFIFISILFLIFSIINYFSGFKVKINNSLIIVTYSFLYLFSLIVFSCAMRSVKTKTEYEKIMINIRNYFTKRYENTNGFKNVYYNKINVFSDDAGTLPFLSLFLFFSFAVGSVLIYHIFKHFITVKKEIIIIGLAALISLFLCYILYFCYRNLSYHEIES